MVHLIVAGPAGCGKTTVATALAQQLHVPFLEGDSLHSAANIAKMRAGIGLEDADRWPWLQQIAAWMQQRTPTITATGSALSADQTWSVVTCSALKRRYRDFLADRVPVTFVFLAVPQAILEQRVATRHRHFAGASLVPSQLADLEPLQAHEPGYVVDASQPVQRVCLGILEYLKQDAVRSKHVSHER